MKKDYKKEEKKKNSQYQKSITVEKKFTIKQHTILHMR